MPRSRKHGIRAQGGSIAYTKEELKGRVFCSDRERWIEAAAKDYRSKEEAKVQAIKNGIMLPLRKIPGTNSFAGGVCNAHFKFVAGLRRARKATKLMGGG